MTFRNIGIGLANAGLFLAGGAKVVKAGPNQATREAAAIERPVAKAFENLGNLDVVFATVGIAAATQWGKLNSRPSIRDALKCATRTGTPGGK